MLWISRTTAVSLAFSFALIKLEEAIPTMTRMIAITINNSMREKPADGCFRFQRIHQS